MPDHDQRREVKHIGMDLHSTTTDICVRDRRGKIIHRSQISTTPAELENFIRKVRGKKRVAVEESPIADWVTRVLKPHVDEVIRAQPRFNKLISKSEDKCDKTDCEALSDLLYLNRLKPVYHPNSLYKTLREAVRAYWIASRELSRAKNRVKAFFLSYGMHEAGKKIYSVRNRNRILHKLEELNGNVALAQLFYERMDLCRQLKAKHIHIMRDSAGSLKDSISLLMTIPAIGPVSAYTLVAYLEEGQRIPNKRKLWRYSGLSLRRHQSGSTQTEGASYTGNRRLKQVLISAATKVAQSNNNALAALWKKDIRRKVDPKRARRNLARKIAVIAQHLLRARQEYSDARLTGIKKSSAHVA
jgi:transposase